MARTGRKVPRQNATADHSLFDRAPGNAVLRASSIARAERYQETEIHEFSAKFPEA
jgi:hypothetical protein